MYRSIVFAAVVALGGALLPQVFAASSGPASYTVPCPVVVQTSEAYSTPHVLILPAPSAGSVDEGFTPSPEESRFVALVNRERTRRGLRPLAWEPSLCVAGRRHSEEMARLEYFDHRSPSSGLETPADRWERVTPQTPNEYVIGENLFYGSVPDVAWGHASLMESDAHRSNLLNPTFTRIGVGVHVDRKGRMWATQMFLS